MVQDSYNAAPASDECGKRLWLERLRLTDFRNYTHVSLDLDERPVVLTGANGAGKTNLLEAVSLLSPGRGLRQMTFQDITRAGAAGGWAVAGKLHGPAGTVELGTGLAGSAGTSETGRQARIDGKSQRSSGALGYHVRLIWLTPQLDGLFTGPAAERRRFLDRLVQSLDPSYRTMAGRFERAMRQRNRLFEIQETAPAHFEGLELQMAETAVAVAAARRDAIAGLDERIAARREREPHSPFPWATIAIDGTLERRLAREAATDVEDAYRSELAASRNRDRAAKRTLEGPHRSDLIIGHGPKGLAAKICSTGEQKAVLTGLILAHAELIQTGFDGWAPLILLDEIAAHLDEYRRSALFHEIDQLGVQAWMTGTDVKMFEALGDRARFITVDDGSVHG